MSSLPSLRQLVVDIKRQKTPVHTALYRTAKRLKRVEIPAPKAVFGPLRLAYQGSVMTTGAVRRVALFQPMFRSACETCGPGLQLENGFPYLHGDLRLRLGKNVALNGQAAFVGSKVLDGPTLTIGDGSRLSFGVVINVGRAVTLGRHVRVAEGCFIFDVPGHPLDADRRRAFAPPDAEQIKPVTIGDDVWLGTRVVVMPGVTIGEGCVVAAGSVVTRDLPAHTLAAGYPAEVVRRLNEDDRDDDGAVSPGLLAEAQRLVQATFGLDATPPAHAHADDVAGWDSLGALELVQALSQAGVQVDLHMQAGLSSVPRVARALATRSPALSPTAPARPTALSPQTPAPSAVHSLVESAQCWPAKRAMVINGEAVTYSQLVGRVVAGADALLAAGLTQGGRVLVAARSKADFVVGLYATWAAGGVAIPTAHHEPRLLASLAERFQASLVVGANGEGGGGLSSVALPGPCGSIDDDGVSAIERVGDSDVALLMLTSGTSGKRKAVSLTHANLARAEASIREFMGMTDDVVELVGVPLTHSFGLGRVRAVFAAGGTLLLDDGTFRPAQALQTLQRHGGNALSLVPAGLALFQGPAQRALDEVGPNIRWLELGSAPLSGDAKRALCHQFPNARLCMHYGLTEASRSTFLSFHDDPGHLDTVGRPSPGVRVTVVGPDGTLVPRGQPGEVAVEGDHVFVGYDGDRPLTARVLSGGRLRTGDRGHLDENGYLHLHGRLDDVINVGGAKVAPAEIECPLQQRFPEIELAAVGVPDPRLGMTPAVAYVRREDGRSLSRGDVLEVLAASMERTKLPRAVVEVAALPRTTNGKLRRQALAAEVRQQLNRG